MTELEAVDSTVDYNEQVGNMSPVILHYSMV